jgi:hypothetical protein
LKIGLMANRGLSGLWICCSLVTKWFIQEWRAIDLVSLASL